MIKRFIPLLTTILPLILTFPVLAQRPDAPLYAQPGAYAVGVIDTILEDNPNRQLPVSVWYPAQAGEGEAPTYRSGLFAFSGGSAIRDAAPDGSGAPYPVVIYSHGSGSHRAFSLYLMEHLASHGFVVIAPDHVTNTAVDEALLSEQFQDNLAQNYFNRPTDILRSIDYAERLNASDGELAGLLDLNNIALMGHSFGGYTALATLSHPQQYAEALSSWCDHPTGLAFHPDAAERFMPIDPYQETEDANYNVCFLEEDFNQLSQGRQSGGLPRPPDRRIKAVIVLAPWNATVFTEDDLQRITIPALVIVGSADTVTPPERDAYVIFNRLGSPQKWLAVFQNADHFIYIDQCREFMLRFGGFYGCSDQVWDMERAHDLINHLTTAFLRATLYDDPDALAALNSSDFRGVDLVKP